MQVEKLIIMANQVGDFYGAFPDQAEARQEIAGHLNKFWSLNMRKSIAVHVQEQQGVGLQTLVAEAIQQHLKLN